MKQLKGNLILFITALIWGLAFVAQSEGMDYVGPFTFVFFRFLIAVVFLIPIVGFTIFLNLKKNSEYGRIVRKSIMAGIYCGVPITAGYIFQQLGIVGASAGKAGFVTTLYIVMVPLVLAVFMHQKAGANVYLAVLLAVVGFYFLCITEEFTITRYDLYLVLDALGYTIQIIIIDRMDKDINPLILNLVQFTIAMVASGILMVSTETVVFSNLKACIPGLLYLGILSSDLAITMQIVGQKYTDPTVASLIMSFEAVFAALGGWLILHDVFSTKELCGCLLIFAAVILAQLPESIFIKKKA